MTRVPLGKTHCGVHRRLSDVRGAWEDARQGRYGEHLRGTRARRGRRDDSVKFRVERDVFADAVAWTARSIPTRPGTVPQLSGIMLATTSSDGLAMSGFDYETSAEVTARPRSPTTARSWCPGACWPTSPAPFLTSPVEVALDGSKPQPDLRQLTLQPADDAGRGLSRAAGDAPLCRLHRLRLLHGRSHPSGHGGGP